MAGFIESENEICLESFYDNPLNKIPLTLIVKLDQQMPDIIQVLKSETDPSHQLWHIAEGVAGINFVSALVNLTDTENKKAQIAFRFHDLGYRAVAKNIVTYEEHHIASLYFASKLTRDSEILSAVYYHSNDVLPFNTPPWARLVNNIDRMLGNGWIGVTRSAIYKGFSHPAFEESFDEAIKSGVLCDLNHPLNPSFDKKAEKFFIEEVLPFFKTQEQLIDLSLLCKKLVDGVEGFKWSEQYPHPGRFCSLSYI